MTLSSIVQQLVYRLGNTSTEALARLETFVNNRYQWVCSDVGLEAFERTIVTATTTTSPLLTFSAVTRLMRVYDATVSPERVLTQVPLSAVDMNPPTVNPPVSFALWGMTSTTVTIRFTGLPGAGHVISMLGDLVKTTLTSADEPGFPAQFHDLLIYGAEADEYSHRQMSDMALKKEAQFAFRLSQLKLFVNDSDFKQLRQGIIAQPNRRIATL